MKKIKFDDFLIAAAAGTYAGQLTAIVVGGICGIVWLLLKLGIIS